MEPSAGQLVAQIVTAVVCVTACFLSIFQLIAEYKFRQELSHREEGTPIINFFIRRDFID